MNELKLLEAEIEKSKFILDNSMQVIKGMLLSEKKQIKELSKSIKMLLKTKKGSKSCD